MDIRPKIIRLFVASIINLAPLTTILLLPIIFIIFMEEYKSLDLGTILGLVPFTSKFKLEKEI